MYVCVNINKYIIYSCVQDEELIAIANDCDFGLGANVYGPPYVYGYIYKCIYIIYTYMYIFIYIPIYTYFYIIAFTYIYSRIQDEELIAIANDCDFGLGANVHGPPYTYVYIYTCI